MNEMRDDSTRLRSNRTWPKTGRARRTALGLAGITAAAGAVMVLSSGGASASPQTPAQAPSGQHQVLCHRTNSNTNPYVVINPSISSIIKKHGHDGHNGPIWDPTLKAQHIKWGDIIPPFDYPDGQHYDGKNWTAEGIAIFENSCKIPGTPESSTPESSTPVSSTPASSTPASSTPVKTKPEHSTSATVVPPNATSQGPIPQGVSAGLHTPIDNAGLKAWGIVLMLLGGAAGLLVGVWPTRRRVH